MMWKNNSNFHLHTLLTIGVWLDIFGLIGFTAGAFISPDQRLLFILLDVILLFLLVISVFKASMDVYHRDTTKLAIINDQKNDLNRYIYSRFLHLYLRNNQQVDIEIEWFNGTLFELSFELAREGVVRVNELQRKIESLDKRTCQHSSYCSYIITLTDREIIDSVRGAISSNKPVRLFLVFMSDVIATYEYEPKSTRQWSVQCSINQIVIPEKV